VKIGADLWISAKFQITTKAQTNLFIFLELLKYSLRKRSRANGEVCRKRDCDFASEEIRDGVIIFCKEVTSNDRE
jgi:hypothetical protein